GADPGDGGGETPTRAPSPVPRHETPRPRSSRAGNRGTGSSVHGKGSERLPRRTARESGAGPSTGNRSSLGANPARRALGALTFWRTGRVSDRSFLGISGRF